MILKYLFIRPCQSSTSVHKKPNLYSDVNPIFERKTVNQSLNSFPIDRFGYGGPMMVGFMLMFMATLGITENT